jgi:hypothetical protein
MQLPTPRNDCHSIPIPSPFQFAPNLRSGMSRKKGGRMASDGMAHETETTETTQETETMATESGAKLEARTLCLAGH